MPPIDVPPTTTDVVAWLGAQGANVDADTVDLALTVALDEQADVCVVDPYTPSLHYAALRRAARVIAARPHTLGTIDSADFGVSRLSRWDAEIQTAEAAYLRGGFA